MEGCMAVTSRDDQRIRYGLALLEMSLGALSFEAPTHRAVRAFAELARGLGARCPEWLRPWPVLEIETTADDGTPLLALTLRSTGGVVRARETVPTSEGLAVDVVLEYYLHLVTAHLQACRVAARRPAGVTALSPGEQAEVAEAYEEVDRVLQGACGHDRLAVLWDGTGPLA
jgi:hypothetical protein